MRKIKVRVSDGNRTYEEDVTEEQKEMYDECTSNSANSWLEKISFEHYTRPVKEDLMDDHSLDKYNKCDKNSHFVFGWMECFSQSDDVPMWIYEAKQLTIEVVVSDE